MKKVKYIIVYLLMLCCSTTLIAQDMVIVNPEVKKNIEYDFNSEWQYLSTDLYLFNATKFQPLLNEIYYSPKKKKKFDDVRNILITTNIDGTSLGNLSYPIYNFNVDNTLGDMKTFTSENYEAVNVIDNLPISTLSGGKIDASINIDVITGDKINRIYDFVSEQLTKISSLTTPLGATKTLVGELGALIKAKSNNQEYRFNSTIRLYEERDFNKKICSVSVYSFIPSQQGHSEMNFEKFEQYFNTEKEPTIDRKKIQDLIGECKYPYFVVVNYKSKYISEPVVGDDITSEYVETRLAKIKRSYNSNLISNDIYTQELKLIEFLKAFITLKNSINNYTLNYNNQTTNDFRKMFQKIFVDYRTLRNINKSCQTEYINNSIYQNEFKQTYESIMRTAEIYLDADKNLKNIKKITQLLSEYNFNNITQEQNELVLQTLHSIDFSSQNDTGVTQLNKLINRIENQHYNKFFANKVEKLNKLTPSTESTEYCETLKSEINATYCKSCKTHADVAISDYFIRLEDSNKVLAIKKLNNTITTAKDCIFATLQKEQIMKQHFDNDYKESMPMDVEFVYQEYLKMQQNREKLQSLIKFETQDTKTSEIENVIEQIQIAITELATLQESICKKMPKICE
ncbi:MAG: hypothetical protein MJ211_05615 [Bacteroidales bacterium]|nr:hypothetical protein [Bacteroidales bacterium]